MKRKHRWHCLGLLLVSFIAAGSEVMELPASYSGVVTAVSDGSLYLGGLSHSIATVKTERGVMRVAVPTIGVLQALRVGESVSFSGPTVTVNSESVINTQDGFFLRPAEKSLATYMADMQAQAQAQLQTQMRQAEKTGIPNAIPTMLMESREQRSEHVSTRRTDLLLGVMTILIGLLAIERVPRAIKVILRWLKKGVRR